MSFHFYFVVSSLFCSGNCGPSYIFLASLRQFFLISFRICFTSLHHCPTLFTFLRQFFYFPSLIPYFLSAFSFFTSLQHFCFSFFTLPSKSLLLHTVLLLPPLSVFILIYANQGRQGC